MPTKTPDVTPAQIVAWLTAILGAAIVLFKLDLTDAQRAAATTVIGAVVPAAWQIADAIVRRGRAQVAAAQYHAASLQSANAPVRGGSGFAPPGATGPAATTELPHDLAQRRPPT